MEKKKLRFKEWQLDNPERSFRDFFADNLRLKVQRDTKHNSLGQELKTGEFGEVGTQFFERIARYGLTADDVCVDYGCGTLRLGVHAMNYVKPGNYWGFEIADFLLEEGRKLIGETTYQEKRPNLRVISHESVAEAAAAKPKFLFSARVLKSVHPDELGEFLGNVIVLIGTSGRAVIQGHWSKGDTFQYGKRKWGHSIPGMREFLEARGYKLMIYKESESEKNGHALQNGLFAVAHNSVELLPAVLESDDPIQQA